MKASRRIKKLFRGGMSLKAYVRSMVAMGATLASHGVDPVTWFQNKRKTPFTQGTGVGAGLGPEGRRGSIMCAGASPHPHVAAGCTFAV